MPTANHLINALVAQDADGANTAFEAAIQDKLADYMEVRKVEIASTIMDDLTEGKKWNAVSVGAAKTNHTHQVVFTVPGEGKEKQYYHVTADDEDHAKEQLMDAEPKAKIHKVEKINEGEGMNAQRRWVRQVAAIGKEGSMKPMHRADLKKAARQVMKKYSPHGAEFLEKGADFVKGARASLRKEETLEEAPTRKHFQQVADLIKEIPDEAKRKELAKHHAGVFKGQNPRFDHKRFYDAAGVKIDEALEGGSKTAAAAGPSNAQLNRNVLANIRKASQTLKVGVNPTLAAAAHRDFGKLAAKNPKAPGYLLMRKLSAQKAQAMQGLTSAGVPLGQALEANPNEFNQAIQRIKRFK